MEQEFPDTWYVEWDYGEFIVTRDGDYMIMLSDFETDASGGSVAMDSGERFTSASDFKASYFRWVARRLTGELDKGWVWVEPLEL